MSRPISNDSKSLDECILRELKLCIHVMCLHSGYRVDNFTHRMISSMWKMV